MSANKEVSVVGDGENDNKRSRASPTTPLSAEKKPKVDPTEGEIRASTSSFSFGKATNSEQQVQPNAYDTEPLDVVEISSDSDNQDEELGMVYNPTENEAQLQYLLPSPSTESALSSQDRNYDDSVDTLGLDQPRSGSSNSDPVEGQLVIDEDANQMEPDDIDSMPPFSDDEDEEQGNPEQDQDMPSSPLQDQYGSEEQVLETESPEQGQYQSLVEEEQREIGSNEPSPRSGENYSCSEGADREDQLDNESDRFISDSEDGGQEQSDPDEEQDQREGGGTASYRLDLRARGNRRDLERVTDLQPLVRLSKELTADARDFKILRVIGIGAYGKVFVVRKLYGFDAGQVYAMKVIPKMRSIRTLETAKLVKSERQILEAIQGTPFVVSLQYAFQTRRYLYLVMNFVQGGELYSHVLNSRSLPEQDVCLYIAEVVVALLQLHEHNILYRDLKLENILIDSEGHIVLTDFGLATILTEEHQFRAHNFCGTLEYMAPEVIRMTIAGYGKPVDWWSLGVLSIELLTGISPFAKPNLPRHLQQAEIERSVLHEELQIPSTFSPNAADLVRRLLEKDPSRRLGASGIREHPFFADINWSALSERTHRMPFLPPLDTAADVRHFDSEFTSQSRVLPPCEAPPRGLRLYSGFNYTAPQFLEFARQRGDETIVYRNPEVENISPRPHHLTLGRRVERGVCGIYFVVEGNAMAKIKHLSVYRGAEVDVLMSCCHTNIINFINVYRDKTEIWIITEYAGGLNLSWCIRNNIIDERISREVFWQLVMAVRHLHRKHCIHGDLRPENLVIQNQEELEIKLVEFGNACYNSDFRQWPDRARYTLDYAPPELLTTDGYAIYSPAVDIYGLGATLYCMMVGHPPYRQNANDVDLSPETQAHLKELIRQGSFNQTSEKWRNASPPFRNLVRWCLRREPWARPQIKDIMNSAWVHGDSDEEDDEPSQVEVYENAEVQDVENIDVAVENEYIDDGEENEYLDDAQENEYFDDVEENEYIDDADGNEYIDDVQGNDYIDDVPENEYIDDNEVNQVNEDNGFNGVNRDNENNEEQDIEKIQKVSAPKLNRRRSTN